MRVLLVSFGAIGRRHLANLRQLEPAAEVAILRRAVDPALAEKQITTLDEALAFAPDAALICSPAPQHVAVATALAARGVPLFIEKPLSHNLDGVADLLALAREKGAPLMVGYNLRFSPALRELRAALHAGRIGRLLHLRAEVGQYLPDWRPATDYRDSVTAQRALGGGVLLEISHEIDYALWLAGEVESVTAQVATLSDLECDVEDCADLQLRFRSGALGTIHLDLLDRIPHRTCRLVGTEGTLSLDLLSEAAGIGATYLAVLRHFLHCARTRTEPEITGEDGLRVLEVIAAARRPQNNHPVILSEAQPGAKRLQSTSS